MKSIRIHSTGGPEVLMLEDLPIPTPQPGEALVRIEAAGVNYIDTYQRSGLYKVPLPFTPGQEAAGVVEAVGAGVTGVRAGDRVAYAGALGAYAEWATVPAARLVPLPEGLSAEDGAAAMLQGMTAHYLATTTFVLRPGHSCLIHAAAGGVGLLLVQIAKLRGATVIGTVGSEAKAELACAAGADHAIVYRMADFAAEVQRLTGGRGVDVVYDGVGKDTFDRSLECVAPRGLLAMFGNASGPVPPFDILRLQAGPRFLTRPRLSEHIATREELLARSGDVLGWIVQGKLRLSIYRRYPLAQASQAHRDLESRATTGKLLLVTK